MRIFSDRLAARRDRLGLTQRDLAKIVGVSLRTICSWEGCENYPQPSQLRNLADKLHVPIEWLIGGKEDELTEETMPYRTSGTHTLAGTCPVISWARVGAEDFAYDDLGNCIYEHVQTDCRDPDCFALIVEGASMEPRFLAGDRVIVSPGSEPRTGDYVIARLIDTGGVLFKHFKRTGREGQTIALESINPDYPPKEYPQKSFRFIYPVVGMIAKFRR